MALLSMLKGTAQVKRGSWVCRSKAGSPTRAGDPQPPRKAACWVLAGLRTELLPAPMPARRPLQVSAEPSRVDSKAKSICCVCESANTENGNPWEAKEIQILPSELAFSPSPCPPPPPDLQPINSPLVRPLTNQTGRKQNSVLSVTFLQENTGRAP